LLASAVEIDSVSKRRILHDSEKLKILLEQQRSLEALSVILTITKDDLKIFMTKKSEVTERPIIANIFWPKDNFKEADESLPLSSHVRDFVRHFGSVLAICLAQAKSEFGDLNLKSLQKSLTFLTLLAEYLRFQDWIYVTKKEALTHSTYIGPGALSFASLVASVIVMELGPGWDEVILSEHSDTLLFFVLSQLSSLPWFVTSVIQSVLDKRCSPSLLQSQHKEAPKQLMLYHIVARYFYLVPWSVNQTNSCSTHTKSENFIGNIVVDGCINPEEQPRLAHTQGRGSRGRATALAIPRTLSLVGTDNQPSNSTPSCLKGNTFMSLTYLVFSGPFYALNQNMQLRLRDISCSPCFY